MNSYFLVAGSRSLGKPLFVEESIFAASRTKLLPVFCKNLVIVNRDIA